MIADLLFKGHLSLKLKILMVTILAAVGLLVFAPQAQAQPLLTPQQVAERQVISPPPWPTFTQTASPNPASVGQPVTFTITVINNSGYQGDRVSSLLSEGAALASPPTQSTPNGGCSLLPAFLSNGALSSRSFTCWVPLPPGGAATVTASVIPATPGTITTTAQDYFGQQVQTPVAVLPTGTPATTTVPPSASAVAPYVVQPNDTLSGIAQRFGTSVEAIAQGNGIVNPNLIFPGQRLSVPTTG